MDLKQIQELIKIVSKSDLSVLKIEQENFKITLKKGADALVVHKAVQQAAHEAAHQAAHGSVVESETVQSPTTEESVTVVSTGSKSTGQEKPGSEEDKYITIKSPMVGTFYRASSPDKEPFVKVGDLIRKGDHICIIEAMKLFNEIESEFDGKVLKVLVEDAKPVEYEQPLFLIDPSGV